MSSIKTYDLDGFVETMELLIDYARARRLVAASVNLDPNGLGHYSFKLLDGEIAGEEPDLPDAPPVTPATAPGKGQKP